MRIRISHDTIYRYDTPVSGVIQTLRLTPRNARRTICRLWRIDVSADCPLAMHEDAFGNIAPHLHGRRSARTARRACRGRGRDRGHQRRRQRRDRAVSALVVPARDRPDPGRRRDRAIRHAHERRVGEDALPLLHALLAALQREISFDTDPTHVPTTAAEAFALKRGVCQDLTPYFHRRGALPRHPGALCRRAISIAPTA